MSNMEEIITENGQKIFILKLPELTNEEKEEIYRKYTKTMNMNLNFTCPKIITEIQFQSIVKFLHEKCLFESKFNELGIKEQSNSFEKSKDLHLEYYKYAQEFKVRVKKLDQVEYRDFLKTRIISPLTFNNVLKHFGFVCKKIGNCVYFNVVSKYNYEIRKQYVANNPKTETKPKRIHNKKYKRIFYSLYSTKNQTPDGKPNVDCQEENVIWTLQNILVDIETYAYIDFDGLSRTTCEILIKNLDFLYKEIVEGDMTPDKAEEIMKEMYECCERGHILHKLYEKEDIIEPVVTKLNNKEEPVQLKINIIKPKPKKEVRFEDWKPVVNQILPILPKIPKEEDKGKEEKQEEHYDDEQSDHNNERSERPQDDDE